MRRGKAKQITMVSESSAIGREIIFGHRSTMIELDLRKGKTDDMDVFSWCADGYLGATWTEEVCVMLA